MQHRRLYLIAGAIALVIIAGFALSVPRLRDAGRSASEAPAAASATPLVYLHDAYKKGTHSLTGKVAIADPCIPVSAEAHALPAASGTPPAILISLDIPPPTGVCLEETATATFMLTVAAGSDASFSASINGTDASTSSY
jgi:hypothetical protein